MLLKFWKARHIACGSRLKSFKSKGGMSPTGYLQFRGQVAPYELTFNVDGAMTNITHFNGGIVDVDLKTGLCRDHKLNDAHDDWAACLSMPPMADVKLHTFFAANSTQSALGPYKVKNFHGKAKDLVDEGTKYHEQWSKSIDNRGQTASASVKRELEKDRQQKMTDKMSVARAQAKAAMAKKKARRTIDLKERSTASVAGGVAAPVAGAVGGDNA